MTNTTGVRCTVAAHGFSVGPRPIAGALVALALGWGGGRARAQASGDGYCDFVQGRAAAESALLSAPEAYAELGRIEQSTAIVDPTVDVGTVRLVGGLRYRVSGMLESAALRGRATADCRRHEALQQVRGAALYQALTARAQAIDGALPEAEKLLGQVQADFEARRITAPEANATRLRVDELRRLAAETRLALAALPAPPAPGAGVGLAAFHAADADVERQEARLRRARAFDVNLRVGFDQFLDADTASSPYYAVVTVGVNLGLLWQGRGNARAAAGRRTYVRSGRDPLALDATSDRMRALIDAATQRAQDTSALEADLQRQLDLLAQVGGDEAKRYRQVLWFDLIKVRAERAYHEAHAAALKQIVGGSS